MIIANNRIVYTFFIVSPSMHSCLDVAMGLWTKSCVLYMLLLIAIFVPSSFCVPCFIFCTIYRSVNYFTIIFSFIDWWIYATNKSFNLFPWTLFLLHQEHPCRNATILTLDPSYIRTKYFQSFSLLNFIRNFHHRCLFPRRILSSETFEYPFSCHEPQGP